MQIKRFKLKRKLENISDKIKNFFLRIGEFFHLIRTHPGTEAVSYHVKKVSKKFSSNLSNNNKNWKHRIASSPSFEITEDDG